jgi:hypothetical protein
LIEAMSLADKEEECGSGYRAEDEGECATLVMM